MPIPTPRSDESEGDFVSRCMEAQAGEDKPQDQKLAICYSAWRREKAASADAVVRSIRKALEEGDDG